MPGNWNRQGHDRSIYTNMRMPWDHNEPNVPPENPTGLYRTTFTVPAAWRRRRTVLHLGGVESAFTVYVNGRFVGMGKDSRLPSEFDISPHLRPGKNTLAVQGDVTNPADLDRLYAEFDGLSGVADPGVASMRLVSDPSERLSATM